MSNSNSIQSTIDPSSFYFLKSTSDLSNCPVCLKQMEKNAVIVGHIFKKTILHCVHETCWREYAKSMKNPNYLPCVICKTQFKALITPQLDHKDLSSDELTFLVYNFDESKLKQLIENLPKPLTWKQVVEKAFPIAAPWLIDLTTEEKRELCKLGCHCKLGDSQNVFHLKLFLEFSQKEKDILFELGIDFMLLPHYQRSWFLNLPENRRRWILEHCTPPIDFLCEEQEWLAKVSDEEMEWSLSVLPSIDRIIYKNREGVFGKLFFKGLITSKKNWAAPQRKEFLTLLFAIRKCERIQKNLKKLSTPFISLTPEEKGVFLGLFRANLELYRAVLELTDTFYLPEDQKWLKDPSTTIPINTPEAILITALQIPHQKLSWKIGNVSGEEIEGAFRSLIITSTKLKDSEKGWLLSLTNPEKTRIALLKSSALKLHPNDRAVFFNLEELRVKWITTFSGIPELFIQKELVWLKELEEKDLESSLALAGAIPMIVDFLVKEENLLQAKANLEIFLKMMSLQRFVNRLKTKRYDGVMEASENLWLNNCVTNLKFLQTLIEQGIRSGIFCGEDARQLIRLVGSKDGKFSKSEEELLQIAHKAYLPNGKYSFPDVKFIALGYLAGYAVTHISNSNNLLRLLVLGVAAFTLKNEIRDYDSFEKGDSRGKWASKRSLKVGTAAATTFHSVGIVAISAFLLIGLSALIIIFLTKLSRLVKGSENKPLNAPQTKMR